MAGKEWSDNGDKNERGDVVLIKHKVLAGVFNLVVHHTREAGHGLFDVDFGAAVRLNDVGKAPGNCGMLAVNALSGAGERPLVWHMSAPWNFCWGSGQARGVGGWMWEHESFGSVHTETALFVVEGVHHVA